MNSSRIDRLRTAADKLEIDSTSSVDAVGQTMPTDSIKDRDKYLKLSKPKLIN
jgi:hypothetical protein